jgi:hypothetical protein
MKHLVVAAALAVVGLGASAARAQDVMQGGPIQLRDLAGRAFGTPANPISVTGSSSGSTTTTPYVQGTGTNSATTGTYTQALAADTQRTACTVTNTGTGQQSIIQSATQPANGTVSPLPTMSPNGYYSCGGYKGAVWIASTVASDPFGYEGDR